MIQNCPIWREKAKKNSVENGRSVQPPLLHSSMTIWYIVEATVMPKFSTVGKSFLVEFPWLLVLVSKYVTPAPSNLLDFKATPSPGYSDNIKICLRWDFLTCWFILLLLVNTLPQTRQGNFLPKCKDSRWAFKLDFLNKKSVASVMGKKDLQQLIANCCRLLAA